MVFMRTAAARRDLERQVFEKLGITPRSQFRTNGTERRLP
jgi:hypothetical protein